MSYSSEVLADSPLAFWKLNEASGTIADSSGNGRTLAGLNGPAQSASGGPFAGAGMVTLDGSSQRLDSNQGINHSDYTIEFWYKGTDGAGVVASARDAFQSISVRLGQTPVNPSGPAGSVNVGLDATQRWVGAYTTAVVNDGVWHHIVCVWDGVAGSNVAANQFTIYIDGVAAPFNPSTYQTNAAPISSGGGGYKFGETLAGSLSHVALYGAPLSSARVAAHYAAATAPAEITGSLAATLPALSANLSGGIEFAGTITAVLPPLGANLSGTSIIAGIAGDISATLPPLGGSLVGAYSDAATLAAILPPLSASLTATYVAPPVTGTLAASLPSLAASLAGTAYEPGMTGTLNAVLPALSALLSGDVLGRNGFGLALDSTATLTVLEQVDTTTLPTPTGTPGVPATVLHIIAPTVPAPTLVNGRPQ